MGEALRVARARARARVLPHAERSRLLVPALMTKLSSVALALLALVAGLTPGCSARTAPASPVAAAPAPRLAPIEAPGAAEKPKPELPRGGRSIFPEHRLVG